MRQFLWLCARILQLHIQKKITSGLVVQKMYRMYNVACYHLAKVVKVVRTEETVIELLDSA